MMSYYYNWERPQIRFGSPMTKAVKNLIIANAAVFLLQLVLQRNFNEFVNLFGLVPARLFSHLALWQIFTYMFLHGSPGHLLINMFMLWMFGSDLERQWGSRQFLRYYFITGVGAGLLYCLSNIHSLIPTIGASGAIFGILVAFGMTFPERIILVFFLIPMKAKRAVMLFAGIELWNYLSYGSAGGIARFAHLGGMLVGYLYLKGWWRKYWMAIWRPGRRIELRQKLTNLKAGQEEELEKEVDLILDKISKEGIRSLTRREKRILQKKAKK